MIELAGGGVVRLPGLAPAVVDRLRSPDVLSGSMLLALGGDATSLSLGEVLAGRVAAAVPELAGLPLRAIGLGASLMAYSPAAGLPDINISLGPDLRYVAPESAALGRLEQNVSGQWMPVIANARLYNVMGYTVVLPDEKLGLVIRPLTTPIVDPDPWPGTMLPLPPWANKVELTPPYEMDNNPGPTILTTPGTPVQTAADLIIQNGNAPTIGANSEDTPSLLDPKGEQHILDGDKTGGGHRPGTGSPGKSEFPSGWSDDRIKGEISDVATDPASSRSPGRNGREVVRGTRGGIDIEVIVEPNGRIVTGYPTNVPRNPR